jgi:branched-chain amino acid transport system substrate-binding protein
MLTPRSTGMMLFEEKLDYIFRWIGSNEVFAQAIALNMAEKGYKNIAIYYSEDEFGIDLAKILEKTLNAQGIRVIDRVSSITPLNIEQILNRWNAFGCNGIIIAATYPTYIEPIKIMRRNGSWLPLFNHDSFERLSLEDLPEEYFDSLYVTTLNRESIDNDFLEKFRSEYGHYPDATAISGYEAVMLLADAVKAAQSIDGTAIATYLSNLKDYKAVSSVRAYNRETQEFDGYNVRVSPLKPMILEKYE